MQVPGELEFGVADAGADLDELARHREPVVQVAGIEDRGVAAREAERERVVVTETARHLHPGCAEGVGALLIDREVDLEAQRGEHASPQRVVDIRQDGERLLEEVDRGLVPPGAREHVAAVVGDRGDRQPLGVTHAARHRTGFDERVARAGDVTGAAASLREPEEQVAPRGTGRNLEGEGALEELGGLFVRELSKGLLTRATRVLDGLLGIGARRGVVIRQHAEVLVEPLPAELLQRARDPVVQARAARRARESRGALHG